MKLQRAYNGHRAEFGKGSIRVDRVIAMRYFENLGIL